MIARLLLLIVIFTWLVYERFLAPPLPEPKKDQPAATAKKAEEDAKAEEAKAEERKTAAARSSVAIPARSSACCERRMLRPSQTSAGSFGPSLPADYKPRSSIRPTDIGTTPDLGRNERPAGAADMAQFRAVTERDLRAPEFRDCEPEDMEWRADGTLARKDRREVGIRQIAGILLFDPRKGFEVSEVVDRVRQTCRAAAVLTKPTAEANPTDASLWKDDPGAGTCRAILVEQIAAKLRLSSRKASELRVLLEEDEEVRRAFALLFPVSP